jgi:release factor glutamine methyltransferase
MEGIIAVINDLPVVCFLPSGGVAREMQSLFERYRSRYKHLRIDTCASCDALDTWLADFAARFREQRNPSRLAAFFRRVQPTAESLSPVEIAVDGDLRHVTLTCRQLTMRVPDPVLIVDDARFLEEPATGAAIRSCLESAPRRYCYEGVTIDVPHGVPTLVWCPGIDTFVMLAAIRPHLRDQYRTALDVGTGTGIIAVWMAAARRTCEVVGIDSSPEAAACASVNVEAMRLTNHCTIIAERYQQFRRGSPAFELVLCNPPYIPRLEAAAQDDGAVTGVDLVIDLISTLDRTLTRDGICFLTLSSTSWTDARVRGIMGDLIRRKRATLVHERPLPFKVADVLVDRGWVDRLREGGGLYGQAGDHYALWHTVQVWKLTNTPHAAPDAGAP